MSAVFSPDSVGPVDVAVIAFDGNQFYGDVVPALLDLEDSGTVKIIDITFVRKEHDGSITIVEVAESDVAADFERLTLSQVDLLSDDDLREIGVDMVPDSTAMVIVWENSWAARLVSALLASHGRVISLDRIPRDVFLSAAEALEPA